MAADGASRLIGVLLVDDRTSAALEHLLGRSRVARAGVLLDLRRPAEARRILEPVVAADPHDAWAIIFLAECVLQEGRERRAFDTARGAAVQAPEDVDLLVRCACVARRAGFPDAAARWARHALALHPAHVGARDVLSLVEIDLDRPASALHHAEIGLAQLPDDPRHPRGLCHGPGRVGSAHDGGPGVRRRAPRGAHPSVCAQLPGRDPAELRRCLVRRGDVDPCPLHRPPDSSSQRRTWSRRPSSFDSCSRGGWRSSSRWPHSRPPFVSPRCMPCQPSSRRGLHGPTSGCHPP